MTQKHYDFQVYQDERGRWFAALVVGSRLVPGPPADSLVAAVRSMFDAAAEARIEALASGGDLLSAARAVIPDLEQAVAPGPFPSPSGERLSALKRAIRGTSAIR